MFAKEITWTIHLFASVSKSAAKAAWHAQRMCPAPAANVLQMGLRWAASYHVHLHNSYIYIVTTQILESRRRRTKGSVVGEEWCQNVAPLRWYTKNFFAQSKMILSRAWLHDTVSCAAWNDARKGFFLKPLAATVIEAEANQLCWTTGTSPSWKVCL